MNIQTAVLLFSLLCLPVAALARGPDLIAVVADFKQVVEARVFDPAALDDPAWPALINGLEEAARRAQSGQDLVAAFDELYRGEPFSHLGLAMAGGLSAREMMSRLDQMRVGGCPVKLEFRGDTAILVVRTMMGLDTIEMIEQAYRDMAARQAGALVIDLRGNEGGAFAIKPLIEHVIDRPFDAGFFTTHSWNTGHNRAPSVDEVLEVAPWRGFSLDSWWARIQSDDIIRVRFEPAEPNFDGPTYVLIDPVSASATEMVADAFQASGAALLVGEATAGSMLSQSPFDVVGGFQAFVPVADYHSLARGRIEGVGVHPDVATPAAGALGRALELISQGGH